MSLEIYRLTPKGQNLAHNYRAPNTPEWGVINYLKRRGEASKENIYAYVEGVNGVTLSRLSSRGIITSE